MKKIKNFICSCRNGGPSVDTLNEKSNGLTPVRRVAVAFIVIALMMTVIPTKSDAAGTATFRDVPPDNWAYPYVEAAAEQGWVNGVGNGKFNPDGEVSAAEFCAVLIRTYFQDDLRAAQAKNPGSEWWRPVMDVAWDKLLISSYGGHPVGDDYAKNGDWNKELVNQPIDRYEIANILSSMCVPLGMHTNVYPLTDKSVILEHYPADGQKILDSGDINTSSVAITAFNGLMQGTGDGYFNGDKTMTRAEMATAAVRLYEKENNVSLTDQDKNSGNQNNTAGAESNAATQGGNAGTDAPQTVPEDNSNDTLENQLPPFAFEDNNETVQHMMNRLNAATPPYREGYLTNGKPATAENIEAMLQQIADDWAGKTWDASERYKYYGEPSTKYDGAISGGCNSFAYAVLDYVFGEDGPVVQHNDFDSIKAGDAVWIKDMPGNNSGHVMIVIGKGELGACPNERGYFWVFDGNMSGCVGQPSATQLGHSNGPGGNWSEAYQKNSIVFSRY